MLKAHCGAMILALAATTASAADLPLKAPPAAPPIQFSWTGCYVGGHLGGAVSQDTTTGVAGNSHNFGSTGFVGGGQIGCDYQFASGWVIGAEGRAAWTGLDNTHASTVIFTGLGGLSVPSQVHVGNDFLASATARLGYAVAPRWLVYARGGAAWTHESVDDAFVAPLAGVLTDPGASIDRNGWTVGAGAEWAFAPHWSVNVGYNFYDFGTQQVRLTGPLNSVNLPALKDTIQTATFGVNYRF
jgi:outer membrane immunogenic protein